MTRPSRWQLLVLVLLASACDLGVRSPPRSVCLSDFDCALEDICTQGVCVRVAGSELVVDLSLTPPNDSGYQRQQIAEVRLPSQSEVPDLMLQPSVIFSGRVMMEGAQDENGLRARVEARRTGVIPGTTLRASEVTVAEPTSGRREFRLRLVPGSYQITVYPEEPELPPVHLAETLDLTTSREKDLVLPPRSAFRRVSGIVLQSEIDPTAVAGATVQGIESDGWAVSTVVRTGADGRFTLVFPPSDGVYTIRVTRSEQNPLLPTVERLGVNLLAGIAELAPIPIGTYETPFPYQGLITGEADETRKVPVPSAQVVFSGPAGNGTWVESVVTAVDGSFEVKLPPSSYSVEVRPPLDSDFAMFSGSTRVSEASRGDWVLRRKSRLWGLVTAPDGTVVSGVLVQAIRRGALPVDGEGIAYTRSASTDADGRYSMLLDKGIYDLYYVPEGRPLARSDITSFALSADVARHDQRLPEAVAVVGRLHKQSGEPFVGVTVEVYEHAAAGATSARLLGSALTDGEGRYRVVIPARP